MALFIPIYRNNGTGYSKIFSLRIFWINVGLYLTQNLVFTRLEILYIYFNNVHTFTIALTD